MELSLDFDYIFDDDEVAVWWRDDPADHWRPLKRTDGILSQPLLDELWAWTQHGTDCELGAWPEDGGGPGETFEEWNAHARELAQKIRQESPPDTRVLYTSYETLEEQEVLAEDGR